MIDLSNAFRGLRLCEVVPQKSALNRVQFPRTHNSFHPNEIGHALISSIVVRELLLAGYALSPATGDVIDEVPVTVADRPVVTEAVEAPEPTPASADTAPSDMAPGDTAPSATITGDGAVADCVDLPTSPPIRLDPITTSIRISEAAPDTEVCYRVDGGDWNVAQADGVGVVDIPIGDPVRPLAVDTVFVDRTGSSVTLSFVLSP